MQITKQYAKCLRNSLQHVVGVAIDTAELLHICTQPAAAALQQVAKAVLVEDRHAGEHTFLEGHNPEGGEVMFLHGTGRD